MNNSQTIQPSNNPDLLVQMQTTLTNSIHPVEVHLHLMSGRKHVFQQNDLGLAKIICDDIDGSIFSQDSLIIEGDDEIFAFPGKALIGITILTSTLPDSYLKQELMTSTMIMQITRELFRERRATPVSKQEGVRSRVFSDLEFSSGARLFLEFSEIASLAIEERSMMHHLFTNPALLCRVPGGYSIWNTAHLVSWSHYPKFHAPIDSWVADPVVAP